MKILVTGGAGYIGSHFLIEAIRNTDWELVSVDNFINSSPRTLERVKQITGKEIQNYVTDLRSPDDVKKIFTDHSDLGGIVHFAALKSVPESVDKPLLYYDNNLNGLLNLLTQTGESGIPYFIFSSSCSVYGNVQDLPVNEETALGKPESPYAHTKQIGEGIIESFSNRADCRAISLRYFNPVGADISGLNGEDPVNIPNNLLPVVTRVAAGLMPEMTIYGNDYDTRDGTCIRDYIHVSDIAMAHIKALKYLENHAESKNYEVMNLGTGNGVTVLEAVKAFERVTGLNLNYKIGPRRHGDVEAVYSDTRLSESRLNWKPRYGIDEMMESSWKWQLVLNQEAGDK